MLITLAQCGDSSLRNISGCCPGTDSFNLLLNDATRWVMKRGDWPGLTVPIQVCTPGGCIVFPKYVGAVRKLNLCNKNVPIQSPHYSFLPTCEYLWGNMGLQTGGANFNSYRNWWGNNSWGSWCAGPASMVSQGKSPVFQDMLGEGRLVRAYATLRIDLGKTITIFGTDNNGQRLVTRNADGTQSDGVVITLAAPFGSTSTYVRHIDRVLLDEMQGDVRLYGYNATTDLLEDIGTYEPGDINPAFERYKLTTGNCIGGSCACSNSVVALIKLKFVPARYPNDLVLIDNLDALKLAMQYMKVREAGDSASARELEVEAIREMNLDLNDQSPVSQMPISVNPFSSTSVGVSKCF